MKKAIGSVMAVWIMVSCIFIGLIEFGYVGNVSAPYIPHTPIRINNDAELTSMAILEGWSGIGSQGNPYIIQGYDINGSGYGYCIYIGNTTVYFEVKDSYLHDASGIESYPYFSTTGMILYNVENGTVTNNNISSNEDCGIRGHNSNNNTIAYNTISSNKGSGLYLESISNSIISNNIISANKNYGIIVVDVSDDNKILYNTISYNEWDGVVLYGSTFSGGHIISENMVLFNNRTGINLWGATYNNIITKNHVISNVRDGIRVQSSSNNIIAHNNVSNNDYGISIQESSNNTILNNTYKNDGLFIRGDELSHFNTHTIPVNNTINEKPLYYYKNTFGLNIDGIPAGEVILANCSNFNIRNMQVNNTDVGIEVTYSTNISITDNIASNAAYGLYLLSNSKVNISNNVLENNLLGLWDERSNNYSIIGNDISNNTNGLMLGNSDNNLVLNNTIISNEWYGMSLNGNENEVKYNAVLKNNYGINLILSNRCNVSNNVVLNQKISGIHIDFSTENNIRYNIAFDNEYGIFIEYHSKENNISGNLITHNNNTGLNISRYANDNTINENIVAENQFGIHVSNSPNNLIYNNNFINNTNQSYDDQLYGQNLWNNSYPIGGNYWSDYIGVDGYRGPNQDIFGSDGIGDTNYSVDVDVWDNYPLMRPYPSTLDNENPQADAGDDKSIYEDEVVTFDGTGSYDDVAIMNWTWNFDDGITGYGTNPTHTYPLSGEYFVQLNVTDYVGCWDTDVIKISVLNVPPTANAGDDIIAHEGEQVTFNGNESFDTSSDMDSLVYIWDFGDTNIGNGIILTHVYDDNGIYNVSLNVTDDDGNTSIDYITVTIYNKPPEIMSVNPQVLIEDIFYTLQINVTDVGADTITFTDNSSFFDIDSFTGIISFTPTNDDVGVHLINITAMDDDGGVTTLQINFSILNVNDPPSLESIGELTCNVGVTFHYQVNATDVDYNDVLIFSDDSDLFNINPSTGEISFVPLKGNAGTHQITITVVDSEGATNQTTMTINIIGQETEDSPNNIWIWIIPIIAIILILILFIFKKKGKNESQGSNEVIVMKLEEP